MKIDLNTSSLDSVNLTPANNNPTTSATHSVETSDQDTATLSTDSTGMGALTDLALASPEIRQDKVEALRLAIQNGEYKVETDKIADAMMRE